MSQALPAWGGPRSATVWAVSHCYTPVPFDTDGTIMYLLQGGVNKTVLRTVPPPISLLVGFRY